MKINCNNILLLYSRYLKPKICTNLSFLHLIHHSLWGRDFATKSHCNSRSVCPVKDGVLSDLCFRVTSKGKHFVNNSHFCIDTIVNCLTF